MNMKRFIVLLGSVLVLPALPAYSGDGAQNGGIGIISAPLANVHDRPALKSALVTQVLMGDEVRILGKQEYRYRIAIPDQDGREGWIQQEAVTFPRDRGRSFLNPGRTRIVIAAPKTEALILDKTGDNNVPLYAGTRLPVLESNASGYKVQLPDRSIAMIAAADALPLKSVDPLLNATSRTISPERPNDFSACAARPAG